MPPRNVFVSDHDHHRREKCTIRVNTRSFRLLPSFSRAYAKMWPMIWQKMARKKHKKRNERDDNRWGLELCERRKQWNTAMCAVQHWRWFIVIACVDKLNRSWSISEFLSSRFFDALATDISFCVRSLFPLFMDAQLRGYFYLCRCFPIYRLMYIYFSLLLRLAEEMSNLSTLE